VSVARALDRLFTIEDWLAHEGEPDKRYELVDGRLVAMNPPRTWHGAIANEIGRVCSEALRDRFPCRALRGAGLEIRREPKAKAYIPDIVVTCEPLDENRATVQEPRLVIEVLSPSTDRFDQTDKFEDYKGLPPVEEIWLAMSEYRLVLQAVRASEGWGKPEAFIGEATFKSPVLGVAVALDEIYRYTPMGRTAEAGEEPDPT
jgi:Uma2 family endonuclease